MVYNIALSNLSLLKTALLEGPKTTWDIAREAGFDALKVNPLRGWSAARIQEAQVPVAAFEAPWRFSFTETLSWIRYTADYKALLTDPILFRL